MARFSEEYQIVAGCRVAKVKHIIECERKKIVVFDTGDRLDYFPELIWITSSKTKLLSKLSEGKSVRIQFKHATPNTKYIKYVKEW